MKKLVLCCCAALPLFASNCASNHPDGPTDQAIKMRHHRIAPSEDIEETDRTKQGSPLPPANESTWKF
ncbi:MAG: hypothetical protein V4819_24405 [Verrucomicrobiota bacterium]